MMSRAQPPPGRSRRPRPLPTLMSALLLLGVGGLRAVAPPPDLQLAPQSNTRFHCGPTTLASVLAFHGKPVPEAAIAATIYSPSAHGVLLTDLAWYARQAGLKTELRTGTMDDLQAALAIGTPPIVLLDVGRLGLSQPHFTALTACDATGVQILGTKRTGDRVKRLKFERQWQRAGSQYLLITPSS